MPLVVDAGLTELFGKLRDRIVRSVCDSSVIVFKKCHVYAWFRIATYFAGADWPYRSTLEPYLPTYPPPMPGPGLAKVHLDYADNFWTGVSSYVLSNEWTITLKRVKSGEDVLSITLELSEHNQHLQIDSIIIPADYQHMVLFRLLPALLL